MLYSLCALVCAVRLFFSFGFSFAGVFFSLIYTYLIYWVIAMRGVCFSMNSVDLGKQENRCAQFESIYIQANTSENERDRERQRVRQRERRRKMSNLNMQRVKIIVTDRIDHIK